MVELRWYQEEAIERAVARNGVFNFFFDMRTGKTRPALMTTTRLGVQTLLIVSPLSAVGGWKREIALVRPEATVLDITHGSTKARADKLDRAVARPLIVLTNYGAYWREPLRSAILRFGFGAIAFDELHRIKGRTSKQSTFAHKLHDVIPVRLGLSGSPMTKGPQDLYAEYKAIDKTIFGTRWDEFCARFITFGGFYGKEIKGYRNVHVIERKLAETSYRITKREAMPDLPDEFDEPLSVTLTPTTRRYYKEMLDNSIAQIEGIDPATGQPVMGAALARITLTAILRLQTINSGFAKLPSGSYIDFGTEKLDLMSDLLTDIMYNKQHVVVYARFNHDIDRIATVAKQFGEVYVIDGRVPSRQRDVIERDWTTKGGVLVSQIASTEGRDFAAASESIYYSLDYSLDNWIQSRARLTSGESRDAITHYLLVAKDTVDQNIYNVLAKRENLSDQILDASRARALLT